jgi:hypothetical protein
MNSLSAEAGMKRLPPASLRYRLARTMARLRVAPARTRLLWADRIPEHGRALLLVNGPAGLKEIMLLGAAFERPLHWILDGTVPRALWLRLAGASFGASDCGKSPGVEARLLEACRLSLQAGSMIALFSGGGEGVGAEQGSGTDFAASLAVELTKSFSDPVDAALYPVSLFGRAQSSKNRESLIYVDGPIYPGEHLHRAAGDASEGARTLALALAEARRRNPFRLPPAELAHVLKDVEEILRRDLEDDWARRPDWRQEAQELQISQFVAGWAERSNLLDPARVVALRERIDAARKSRQRWASLQFSAGTAGPWIGSPFRRALIWIESILGFPVALYGLLNHLIPAAIYAFLRRLDRSAEKNSGPKWVAGGIALLGGYTIVVLLWNHWFGRAAAGYYALTLPVSGAYLWRYVWLARNRTPRVVNGFLAPFAMRRLQHKRRAVVLELDSQIGDFSESAAASR